MIFSKYLFDILSLSLLRLPFQELSLAEERCYVVDGGRQSGQFTLQWLKLVHLSISLSLSLSLSCTRPALASAPTPPTLSFSIVYLPRASSCSHRRLSPPSLSLPSRLMRISPRYLRDTRSSRLFIPPLLSSSTPSLESFKTGTPPAEKSLGHEHALPLLFLRPSLRRFIVSSFVRSGTIFRSSESNLSLSEFFPPLFEGREE